MVHVDQFVVGGILARLVVQLTEQAPFDCTKNACLAAAVWCHYQRGIRVEVQVELIADSAETLGGEPPQDEPCSQRTRPEPGRFAAGFVAAARLRRGPTAVATARVALRSLAAAFASARAFLSRRSFTAVGPLSRNCASIIVHSSSTAGEARAASSFVVTATETDPERLEVATVQDTPGLLG